MKKICFYIGSMQKGGAQRVIANLCNFFATQKEVVLINDIRPIQGTPEYEINTEVKRYYLEDNYKNLLYKNFVRIKNLRKIIINEQPEVVLAFMGPPNIRLLFATLFLNVKKVVSVRNDPNIEYGLKIKKFLTNLVFLLADGIVFQTVEASNYFWKSTRNKSKIIYNPVNEKFYSQKRDYIKKEIAVVGRLEEQKNIKLAINAFAKVVQIFPEYKLVLYGDGNEKESLKEYVTQLELEQSVVFHGISNEIEKKLAESTIFLLSSDYEGMPNALMEAMAVGVPVVATDCPCGGPKELIKCHNQGVLVSCNDIDGMSQAIISIISDTKRVQELSIGAKKRASQFETSIILEQWAEYLFEL